MTSEEIKILNDLLAKFAKYEDDCFDKIDFLTEHNFSFEKKAVEIKRSAYHDCFAALRQAMNKMNVPPQI